MPDKPSILCVKLENGVLIHDSRGQRCPHDVTWTLATTCQGSHAEPLLAGHWQFCDCRKHRSNGNACPRPYTREQAIALLGALKLAGKI